MLEEAAGPLATGSIAISFWIQIQVPGVLLCKSPEAEGMLRVDHEKYLVFSFGSGEDGGMPYTFQSEFQLVALDGDALTRLIYIDGR